MTPARIDYNNIYKLRVNNSENSTLKHDIIKLILLKKLLKKYNKEKQYIHIYTEFVLLNNNKSRKTDLFFLNIKTKEAYSYEIQKSITNKWKEETIDFYREWNYPMTRTSDLIIIPIKELSNNIDELSKELDKYIF